MADDAHLALACTPGGQLYLDARPGAPGGGLLSRRRASALLDAFSAELGGGLVHLASAELERELPASLAFGRLLGQRYLEALCHQPDLETRRADLEIAAPTDALFRTNHASNYLPLAGRLPRDRGRIVALIDAALAGQIALKPEWARGL